MDFRIPNSAIRNSFRGEHCAPIIDRSCLGRTPGKKSIRLRRLRRLAVLRFVAGGDGLPPTISQTIDQPSRRPHLRDLRSDPGQFRPQLPHRDRSPLLVPTIGGRPGFAFGGAWTSGILPKFARQSALPEFFATGRRQAAALLPVQPASGNSFRIRRLSWFLRHEIAPFLKVWRRDCSKNPFFVRRNLSGRLQAPARRSGITEPS